MKALSAFLLVLSTSTLFAQTKVALVKLIRGEAEVLTMGKTTPLKVEDWVENGAIVKTAEKSFVKLIFTDKSQMNVGPNSEMKIESFSGKDSGVIDLVKGQIRSQVTKDYLQIKDKDKSKLFIKTSNAVMGVRGTDFLISTNGATTTAVLFEGEIVFNKLEDRGSLSSGRLEEIVDKGVRIYPGEFSAMESSRPLPTVPSLLNVQQKEQLEKNQDFSTDRSPSNAGNEATKSIVPEGLSGQVVSNNTETLKTEVAQVVTVETTAKSASAAGDPNGFVKGDLVKPANGSFVHIESGVIIPPGPGAVLDKNTNTYLPGNDSGKIAADGTYIPPKNVEITGDGKILVAVTDKSGAVNVKEVPRPAPVVAASGVSLANIGLQAAQGVMPPPPVAPKMSDIPLPGTESPRGPAPTGGIQGVNDPQRTATGFSNTNINVRPE